MTPTRGFFSVIQFCPDLERLECANVGIVLAVPGQGFLQVRLDPNNQSPRRRFGPEAYDDDRLTSAMRALESRILEEGNVWLTADDLVRFGKREGNNLVLGPTRTMLVQDPVAELAELYHRLVQVDARNLHEQP